MSELIDRQALLDSVYKNLPMIPSMAGMTAEEMRLRIAVMIENAPTASPWHRVDVEEPTKAGWYLVMDVDGDFNVDEWHNTFGWQFITPSDADRITHWMPIELPKEDNT